MKNLISHLLFIGLTVMIAVLIHSCGTEEPDPDDPQPENPCDNGPSGLSVADYLHSFTGKSSGFVEVTANGGNGTLAYSIDGENFSASNEFTGLAPGNYTITVVDDSTCTATLQHEVKEFPEVSFASDIKPLVDANCQISPCHGSDASLPSWNGYNNIKANAGRIRFMVTSKSMPPSSSGGSLSDQQIQTIQNWVDVGAPNN